MLVAPVKVADAANAPVQLAPLLVAAFDAMSAHTALVDDEGRIVATNRAWRACSDASRSLGQRPEVGRDYLQTINPSSVDEETLAASRGITAVLNGQADSFTMNYICPEPASAWFEMRVTPFWVEGERYAVVSHADVTEARLAEAELQIARDAVEAARKAQEAQRLAVDVRRQITEAVTDTLAVLNRTQNADTVIQGMLQRAVNLLASDAGAVYFAEERWDRPTLVASVGAAAPAPPQRGLSYLSPVSSARAISDRRALGISIRDGNGRQRRHDCAEELLLRAPDCAHLPWRQAPRLYRPLLRAGPRFWRG